MTQEDKELLLKDLCARLPYGVHVQHRHFSEPLQLTSMHLSELGSVESIDATLEDVKPYLFPLSSMTEEQEDEWYRLYIQPLFDRLNVKDKKEDLMLQAKSLYIGVDYLIANHFDYRGLIPMGLAKDATGLNIY